MSDYTDSCDNYADDLAEVALGTSAGRERAAALAHISGCGRCATEVEALSQAADALLHIAPEAEPPLGFEVRLLNRLGVDPAAHRPARSARRRGAAFGDRSRSFVLAAAAVVMVAVGIGFSSGWLARSPSAPSHSSAAPPPVTQAELLDASGANVGRVITSPGQPAWLFMVVDDHTVSAELICRVVLDDGKTITLGRFWIDGGYGTWSSPLKVPAGDVAGAQLIAVDGATVAAARLS